MAKKNCPYCSNPIYDSARRCPFCGRNLDLELARKLERERFAQSQFHRRIQLILLAFALCAGAVVLTIWAAVYSPIGSNARLAATQTAVAQEYCSPEEVRAAADQLIDYNDRWADVMALAVSVERDDLALQVDRLQKLRRDARGVRAPVCMKIAQRSLSDGMEIHIQGLLAYLRGESQEEVNHALTQGNLEMNAFADEVERIQRCAPNCR